MKNENAKRGRPVVSNSARQARLAARAERAAQGLSTSRGRPVNGQSARQQKLAEKANKIASGVIIKRGAPKKTVEIAVAEVQG